MRTLALVTNSPCVRSGYCCNERPCPFGRSDETRPGHKQPCVYLEGDGPGAYKCGIADWILTQPQWELSPAFGAGCCSTMNSDRRDVLKKLYAEIDAMDREQMARLWRFGTTGSEMFQGEVATYFRKRFEELGGWSMELSKKIGWGGKDEPM